MANSEHVADVASRRLQTVVRMDRDAGVKSRSRTARRCLRLRSQDQTAEPIKRVLVLLEGSTFRLRGCRLAKLILRPHQFCAEALNERVILPSSKHMDLSLDRPSEYLLRQQAKVDEGISDHKPFSGRALVPSIERLSMLLV